MFPQRQGPVGPTWSVWPALIRWATARAATARAQRRAAVSTASKSSVSAAPSPMNASTSAMISEANAAWSFFTLCALIRQALADEDVLLSQLLEPPAILRLGSVLLNRVLWDALAVRPALLGAAVEVIWSPSDDGAVLEAPGEGLHVDGAPSHASNGTHRVQDVEALGLFVCWTHGSLRVVAHRLQYHASSHSQYLFLPMVSCTLWTQTAVAAQRKCPPPRPAPHRWARRGGGNPTTACLPGSRQGRPPPRGPCTPEPGEEVQARPLGAQPHRPFSA